MYPTNKLLFGKFPRPIATAVPTGLRQINADVVGFWKAWRQKIEDRRNGYSSISGHDERGIVADEVFLDFDTPRKDKDWPEWDTDDPKETKIFARMRTDEDYAETVLGPVLEESATLAERLVDEEIPFVCIFSGLGMHFHLLYKETAENKQQKMATTARKFIGDLNLNYVDPAPIGDFKRQVRIANLQRVETVNTEDGTHYNQTGVYTVPLKPGDVLDQPDPYALINAADSPRKVEWDYNPAAFPELEVHDHYVQSVDAVDEELDDKDVQQSALSDDAGQEFLEYYLKEVLKMPCMYERIMQPEPHHKVRMNCAVLLFNVGLKPNEVQEVFSKIGWVDYDPQVSQQQLRQIYRHGYADMSCAAIQKEGLCTVKADRKDPQVDDAEECPCHGWSGGKAEWKTDHPYYN